MLVSFTVGRRVAFSLIRFANDNFRSEFPVANDSEVTALYVTRAGTNGSNRKTSPRRRATRWNELAVLKDIGALADRYDVNLRSTTRANMTPDEAILREARRGYDLIVLGVSRRPGNTLFFGNTAAAILDRSETSNLFVAS